MSGSRAASRSLVYVTTAAAIVTSSATFGVMAEGSSRAEVIDQSLATLLLTTLPLAICAGVWSIDQTLDPLLAFGQSRRKSAVRRVAPFLWGFPAMTLALVFGVLVATRGPGDARLMTDALATAPVALMAGATYVLAFLAAREWLGRVGLIVLVLLLVVFGQAEFLGAAALPTAHVRHLLGVGATLPFDPGFSMGALWAFALLAFFGWMARIPD